MLVFSVCDRGGLGDGCWCSLCVTGEGVGCWCSVCVASGEDKMVDVGVH